MDCTGCCMLVREDRACAAPAASEQACRGRCAMFECLYRGMSRFDSSPMTPDMFDYVPPTPGQEVLGTLETCVRKQGRGPKRSSGADAVSSLQEPKRKAIRAALLAGVAPGQVAKHFGLPLAAVRKVLSEDE